jgi:hypothetical protein
MERVGFRRCLCPVRLRKLAVVEFLTRILRVAGGIPGCPLVTAEHILSANQFLQHAVTSLQAISSECVAWVGAVVANCGSVRYSLRAGSAGGEAGWFRLIQ